MAASLKSKLGKLENSPNGDSLSPHPAKSIEYKLSDEKYVQLGWTKKPGKRLSKKITLYETEISKPHLKWHKGLVQNYYPEGGLFYETVDHGGRVYYPTGTLAIKIEKPNNKNYDLYTIFSPGGPDCFGVSQDPQMIANFDSLGNGLVLSENGETRLSYNQIGGIYADNPGALLPLVWTWNRRTISPIMELTYTEAVAARLLTILEKSGQMQKKVKDVESSGRGCFSDDPLIVDVGAVDSLTAVKTICLRLNEFMSLRILDRKNINLRFLWGSRTVRFQLGFNVNYQKPISTSITDTSTDRHRYLRSRVERLVQSPSLVEIFQEYRKQGRK